MTKYYRSVTREYRATLTNGKSCIIVATSEQKAYNRALKWAKKYEGVSVRALNRIED